MPISKNLSILFKGEEILTEKNIEAVSGRRCSLDDGAPDAEILLDRLLGEPLHFQIFPDLTAGPLILEASMVRFPYRLNGEEGYDKFSIRLVPISGRIKEIGTFSHETATRTFCRIFLCTCDSLWIYFDPPVIPLGPIEIPHLFKENTMVELPIGS